MSYVINLGLDPELPLMVFGDVSLLYPLPFVFTRSGRKMRAAEARIQRLVQYAIGDVRRALQLMCTKAEDYISFRLFVVDTLCREYGFVYCRGSIHNILREEVEDMIECPIPKLCRRSGSVRWTLSADIHRYVVSGMC